MKLPVIRGTIERRILVNCGALNTSGMAGTTLNAKLRLEPVQARRFLPLATGLHEAFDDVASALAHMGYVQIDPINVCGRMHDHILRHRVRGYRENDLMGHLHAPGGRVGFEHHLPDSHLLVALPWEAWPHLRAAMRARSRGDSSWSGRLTPGEKRLAARILARIGAEGPLCSQDIPSARKAKTHAWDSTTLAKSTLQKLFFHGRVLIGRREGNRRYYDLPERVLPNPVLHAPDPTAGETARWLARVKLRQRRLAVLKVAEFHVLGDEVAPVSLVGSNLRLGVLREDLPVLEASFTAPKVKGDPPRLVAPLDPILYDRRLTEAVWAFDYRWEVYVPESRRVRGYYALPLLDRGRFIGHSDVKADREGGLLRVISRLPVRGAPARAAIRSLANFLGLKPAE